MTMRITPLSNHYTTEQAVELIALLDTLRDALWNTYGEQIKQMHCQHCSHRNCEQCQLDFDDDIPF